MQRSRAWTELEMFCDRGFLSTSFLRDFVLSEPNHSLYVVCRFICVIIDLQRWQMVWKTLGRPLKTLGQESVGCRGSRKGKKSWPVVRWLRFAELAFPMVGEDKSGSPPYSSSPQKGRRQPTLHHGPLALEGAGFQQLSQDQECDSRE